MSYLYILQSEKTGRYYIGSTNNLKRRLHEHRSGKTKSTRYLLPIRIAYWKEYPSDAEARAAERLLKNKKSRIIIQKIIEEGQISLKGPIV